jgi:multisubunit Na+/H+ antiporter MnhG subunit
VVKRRRVYFSLMGTCVALIVLAWFVVRLWSTTAAVAMSVVAMVIPPVAAVLGNTASAKGLEQVDWDRK